MRNCVNCSSAARTTGSRCSSTFESCRVWRLKVRRLLAMWPSAVPSLNNWIAENEVNTQPEASAFVSALSHAEERVATLRQIEWADM